MVAVSEGPVTRLGQLVLAGEVVDDEPIMPSTLRVMDAYVLSVVLDGEGTYRDADGREERIVPGAHTIVPPGLPALVRNRSRAALDGAVRRLHRTAVRLAGRPGHARRQRPALPPTRAVDRGAADRAADTTAVAQGRGAPAARDGRLAARHRGHRAEVPGPDLSTEIAHAVGRLADDLTGSVDLQTVAAESGLTYDTFRRRFTAQVGQSPSAFRTTRRLQTAATLLRLTDMTHREIARTLGFADEFHFSRRFRAQFGIPPRDYRRS